VLSAPGGGRQSAERRHGLHFFRALNFPLVTSIRAEGEKRDAFDSNWRTYAMTAPDWTELTARRPFLTLRSRWALRNQQPG
jgi:hypothetical protein